MDTKHFHKQIEYTLFNICLIIIIKYQLIIYSSNCRVRPILLIRPLVSSFLSISLLFMNCLCDNEQYRRRALLGGLRYGDGE